MNASKCLLLAIVLALLLPTTASAVPRSPVSGTLQFVGGGAEKRFDKRIGPYYSMPVSGAELTMRIGAYSWYLFTAPPSVREAFGVDAQEPLQEDLRGLMESPILSWVRVRIYDREDPSHVLYAFEGSMADFASQPGVVVAFNSPWAVLITRSVTVPEGQTWWIGKLETYADNTRGHCDVNLIQGGLQAWIDAHGGTW